MDQIDRNFRIAYRDVMGEVLRSRLESTRFGGPADKIDVREEDLTDSGRSTPPDSALGRLSSIHSMPPRMRAAQAPSDVPSSRRRLIIASPVPGSPPL
jgi:hypothetical protein